MVLSHKEKDMNFELVETDEGIRPAIHPQEWNEEQKEWITTSKQKPMTVNVHEIKEFKQATQDVIDTSTSSLLHLTSAVDKLQNLIDDSIEK